MDRQLIYLSIALILALWGLACSPGKRARRVPRTGIWKAVEVEDVRAIEAYAKRGRNLEIGAKWFGRTPLLHALILKKKKSYSALLSAGASPNTQCGGESGVDFPRSAVVHYAAAEEDSFWLREALRAGGDPDLMNGAEGGQRGTPLCFAITLSRIENVRVLCRHGANVNAPCDFAGSSPLAFACGQAKFEIVHYLLKRGADPLDHDREGHTFFDYIRQMRPENYHKADERKWCAEVWKLLADRRMDPARARWNGEQWVWD